MDERSFLRVEGLSVFAATTLAFFAVGGPWWFYLLLVLAPDLSMAGYLAGPEPGATVYNFGHVYLWPLLLVAVGLWQGIDFVAFAGLVWAAHVGADRALGYGLKRPTGFRNTHPGKL